jgi:small conductance mechanosensitive channel
VSRLKIVAICCMALLGLLWLGAPAHAEEAVAPQASAEFLSEEAVAPSEAREANPIVDRIEGLRAELAENRDEVKAMEKNAREARGTDLIALRTQAMELRIDSIEKLRQLVDEVQELKNSGGDASEYRSQLSELLPAFAPALQLLIEAADDSLSKLEQKRQSAKPEDQVAIEQQVSRQASVVGRLLAVGVDLIEMSEELGNEAPATRELVSTQLADRTLLLSGRIDLLNTRISDAEERQAAAPDDTAIQSEIMALRARLSSDTEEFAADLALMDRLGLETAKYKQLLISATGEITTDVFDAEVARGLFASWADGVREGLINNGPGFLFKALLFALVVGGFWLLSHFVRKVTARAVEAPHLRFSQLLKRMIVSIASGTVKLMGVLVALSQLGIQVGPMLAGLGIAGFVLGFALQETLANFAAGAMILAYRPFDVGDLIDCAGGVFGKVSHMSLVSTTILTIDNQTKIVPNGKIWGDVITNVTAQKHRRVDLVFGISYTDDIQHAEDVMWSVIRDHPKVLSDPEPVIKLHELGDSSVNFVVRPWCARDDYWDVYWDVIREVKVRFDREGISIPFPQQDVHFHPVQANGGVLPSPPEVSTLGSDRTAPTGQSEADDS